MNKLLLKFADYKEFINSTNLLFYLKEIKRLNNSNKFTIYYQLNLKAGLRLIAHLQS